VLVAADGGGELRRWTEPDASRTALVLLLTGLGVCLVLTAVSLVLLSWDTAVLAAVLALACAADLRRATRPRRAVVLVPGTLQVFDGRDWRGVKRADVAAVTEDRRPFRRGRGLVRLTDGGAVPLPPGAPVDDVRRWADEL
jgi:hypothetical protein